jgi:para-nitrobenzyl esterase
MKTVLYLLLVAASLPATAADSGPVINVTGGRIRGALLEKGGAVFKGIPFAAPPVGDLRWREPMPVKAWTGVRDATAFGPPCAQNPLGLFPELSGRSKEDCLYLNVWTAEWPSRSSKPVMVWIHGGGGTADSASRDVYNGENLARHGVILVSAEYRLGVFGFFAHSELTKESPHHASGAQAILDQIAALQWVQANVAKFGGDPENVTVFGESAGAIHVSLLMTSPLTKGLFKRVIAESGTVLAAPPLDLPQAEKSGVAIATRIKPSGATSLNTLRAAPAEELLKVSPPLLNLVLDGYVFPKDPAQVFADGQEHHVDLLVGSNAREWLPGYIDPPAALKPAIEAMYGPLARREVALYEKSKPDPLYGTPEQQWLTDLFARCSGVAQLAWHATAGNPAFEYQFDRVSPGRETVGVTHGAELWHVFGTLGLNQSGGLPNPKYNDVDRKISETMQQYWTNFAKTGNPNGGGLPQWPKFDTASRAYIEFTDAGPVAHEGLRRPFCDLFIENVKRQMGK